MDHWGEALALGIDAIIVGICTNMYLKYNYCVKVVQKAQHVGANVNINELSEENKKYAIIRGKVKAVGSPIKSFNATDVFGVIQRLSIKEHAVTRDSGGFWSDRKNLIFESYNTVPFILQLDRTPVEVLDPLSAEILDLDTIHDTFECRPFSLMDYLISFFKGVQQKGLETTEEMLKEGSRVTGIGEIGYGEQGQLVIMPPSSGDPYFLTFMSVPSLIKRLEAHRSTFKWLALLFGSLGVVLMAYVSNQLWKARKERMNDELRKKQLEKSRKQRRVNARDIEELPENAKCVVCRHNPKEIIILPCGHVALCEDCSENINTSCPICRSNIETKAAAFIT